VCVCVCVCVRVNVYTCLGVCKYMCDSRHARAFESACACVQVCLLH